MDFARIRPGDLIWRTHDPDLDKAVRPFLDATTPVAKQPLRVEVVAREGQSLQTRWSLAERPTVQVEVASAAPLGSATNRKLDIDFLRDQLGRLGTSAYSLAEIHVDIDGSPFAPASILNQVRREAVEKLQALQSAPLTRQVSICCRASKGLGTGARQPPKRCCSRTSSVTVVQHRRRIGSSAGGTARRVLRSISTAISTVSRPSVDV